MGTVEIITAIAKIFIMLIPGFLFKRLGVISEYQTNGVSAILTYVTYPCLIIDAMQMKSSPEILNNCKYIALITLAIMVTAFLISKLVGKLAKLPQSQSGLLTFMLIFGNTSFIGLPVLSGLFGQKTVFYVVICDATYNIFLFTIGLALLKSTAHADQGLRLSKGDSIKGLLDPCMIAVIVGLILFFFNLSLPPVVAAPVEMMGSATVPLAMFIVGTQLAAIKFKELIQNKQTYLVCFLKLLIIPLIAFALVYAIIGLGSLLATVIILETAMPSAMSAVIFTKQYNGDVDFATKGVLLSTLLCIVTIPIFAILITSL